jgi:hypothetical protein
MPETIEAPAKFAIKAEVHTDDHNYEVPFDAEDFFKTADAEDIVALKDCGWRGDYAADAVAQHFEGRTDGLQNDEIDELFNYLARIGGTRASCGFEVSVDEDDARAWLALRRPEVLALLGDDD